MLSILVALLLLPFALAHNPAGLPKNYCEDPSEWFVHDYGPTTSLAGISYRSPTVDGNAGGDCDAFFNPGTPCFTVDPGNPLGSTADLCGFNPPAGDFDGHREWALGWARILSSEFPAGGGAGATNCWNERAHHPVFPTITVDDLVLGSAATIYVMTDYSALPPLVGPDCGDGQVNPGLVDGEQYLVCFGTCVPTFPPGADGSYIVVVEGTMGHVITN